MQATWRRWVIACGTATTMTLPLAGTVLMQGITMPRAADGQTLAAQNPATQASFIAVWGDQAGARWVAEHETELNRQRALSAVAPTQAAGTRVPAAQDLALFLQPTGTATLTATLATSVTSQPTGTPTATASPATPRPTDGTPPAASTPATATPGTGTPGTATPATSTPNTSTSSSALSVVDTPRPTPTLPPSPTSRGSSYQPSYTGYPGAGAPIGGTPVSNTPASNTPASGTTIGGTPTRTR